MSSPNLFILTELGFGESFHHYAAPGVNVRVWLRFSYSISCECCFFFHLLKCRSHLNSALNGSPLCSWTFSTPWGWKSRAFLHHPLKPQPLLRFVCLPSFFSLENFMKIFLIDNVSLFLLTFIHLRQNLTQIKALKHCQYGSSYNAFLWISFLNFHK